MKNKAITMMLNELYQTARSNRLARFWKPEELPTLVLDVLAHHDLVCDTEETKEFILSQVKEKLKSSFKRAGMTLTDGMVLEHYQNYKTHYKPLFCPLDGINSLYDRYVFDEGKFILTDK